MFYWTLSTDESALLFLFFLFFAFVLNRCHPFPERLKFGTRFNGHPSPARRFVIGQTVKLSG